VRIIKTVHKLSDGGSTLFDNGGGKNIGPDRELNPGPPRYCLNGPNKESYY